MPYKLKALGHGKAKVENRLTGKTYSKKALPRSRALAQLRAIEIHTHGK